MINLIIVAAGSSRRMGCSTKKEYLQLGEGTVLTCAISAFMGFNIANVVIVIPSGEDSDKEALDALKKDERVFSYLTAHNFFFVSGGPTRQQSVFNALKALKTPSPNDIVLIHDGARPFVTADIIKAVLDATIKYGAATAAVKCVDSQKIIDSNDFIKSHLTRDTIRRVQTPQGFFYGAIFNAHKNALADNYTATDDTDLYSHYENRPVKVVSGDECNFKITYNDDYERAKTFIAGFQRANVATPDAPAVSIGFGYDLHRLVSGRALMIGGVKIPYDKGEEAHSDGDVLLHALIDSFLGAAHLGDIGELFPPDDDAWRDASSVTLLKTVWKRVKDAGFSLLNADCVVVIESPKLLPYRAAIIKSISCALSVDPSKIFVKAKTAEGLGDVGNGCAIESYCTALLYKGI